MVVSLVHFYFTFPCCSVLRNINIVYLLLFSFLLSTTCCLRKWPNKSYSPPPSIRINMHRETTSIYLFLLSDILWHCRFQTALFLLFIKLENARFRMFSSFHFSSPQPPLTFLGAIFLNRSTLHSMRFLPFYPPTKNVSCRNTKKGINQCVVNFYTVGKRLIINFRLVFIQFFLACFMCVCICRRCHYFFFKIRFCVGVFNLLRDF